MTGEEVTRAAPPSIPPLPHPPTLCGSPPISELGRGCGGSAPVSSNDTLTRSSVFGCSGAWYGSASFCRVSGAADCRWRRGCRHGPCSVCCPVLSVLRVWRTLARRPRSERMRGSGSAKRSAVGVVCLGVARLSLAGARVLRRRARGRPVGVSGVAAWLLVSGASRASCYPRLPGAGRDVDGAKTGGDGSGGDGLHPASGRVP